jgi:hypothetical protein
VTTKKAKDSTASSKKRKVSHAGARQKGLQFERDVANALGHIFPEAKRHLEMQADEAQEKRDIDNTGIFLFQCKNHQNYCSIGTINEIKVRDPNHIPVLVTKGNKMEPMAVLPFEKFVTLLEMVVGLKLPFNESKKIRNEIAEMPVVTWRKATTLEVLGITPNSIIDELL